jgi:hypothetical protein
MVQSEQSQSKKTYKEDSVFDIDGTMWDHNMH